MKTTVFRILVSIGAIVLIYGCSGGGASGPTQPAAPTLPATINVSSGQAFSDTYIPITAGETLSVTASGNINYSTGSVCSGGGPCLVTPAGVPFVGSCAQIEGFPAEGLPCWSLIGKITSSGTPFEIGSSYSSAAAASGDLYLGINDNDYNDNSGSWTAIVNVTGQ